MIEFAISEAERLLGDTARRFASDRLAPGERAHEKHRGYPDALRGEYDELGFPRMALEEHLDGLALPLAQQLVVWEHLAAGDPAAPIALSPWGAAARWLAESEPGRDVLRSGADGAVTVAEGLDFTDGTATGTIAYVPANGLDWLAILAEDRVHLVLAPQTRVLDHRPCGLQACGGVAVELDGAPCVSIGGRDQAALLRSELRLFAAALMLGAGRDAVGYAQRYAQERIAFGKPIAHHQGLAFILMDCATDLDAAGLLLYAAATHPEHTAAVANAHALVGEVAQRVAERAVQVLGGHGYLYDHPIEKRMRDIRTLASLYGGVSAAEADAATGLFDLSDPMELPV